MTSIAQSCLRSTRILLPIAAVSVVLVFALISLGAGEHEVVNRKDDKANVDLKSDGALKVRITTNFKKPKIRELLDALEKASSLKFSTNDMIEMNEESFGSLSFRNTPAWIVMMELAKSDAVKGTWEKTEEGYRLNGTLDRSAQEARIVELGKQPSPVPRSWRLYIIIAIVLLVIGFLGLRHFTNKNKSGSAKFKGAS